MLRSTLVLFGVLGVSSAVGWANIMGSGAVGPGIYEGTDLNVNEPFPASGDAYCSATDGCGTIAPGGQTAFSWTAGDFVESAVFTGTGITSLTDLNMSLVVDDRLNSGYQENWEIYANGVDTGWYTYVNCSGGGFCNEDFTYSFTITFGDIAPVAGGYQLEMIESNTIPGGDGAIAWLDGGVTGLSQASTVPEPTSLILLATVLALVGVVGRRKLC